MVTKIELSLPAEGTKYRTALQEAKTLCEIVWATLALLQCLGRSLLEEELARRNQILNLTRSVLIVEAA
ncbi:MAG: hypothetical protein VKJ46_04415 [Leptolyngbyaceae bacterium]|nr:hypothetical protein [Leptolyngbyaceae bacterium]